LLKLLIIIQSERLLSLLAPAALCRAVQPATIYTHTGINAYHRLSVVCDRLCLSWALWFFKFVN